MMSYLYPEDEVTFDKSGFGPLPDMLESYAEEEANSYFELYFEYPLISSHERGDYDQVYVNMSDYLIEGNQVTYKPSHSREPHAFRIYKTEKQVERGIILVWARTRTADLRGNPVRKVKSTGTSVSNALSALKTASEETHPFSFATNIQSNISFEKTQTNVLDALAGEEYSILAITGGQMLRTNNNIYIGINESSKNIVEFRLGKNIEGISYEVDYSNVVTAVIPFYTQTYKLVDDIRDEIVRDSSGKIVKNSDGTTKYNRTVGKKRESLDNEVIVYGDTVFSQYANDYSTPFYSFVEIRDDREDTGVDKDPLPPFTKTDINNRAVDWFDWEENLGVDEPEVSVTVDVHDISQSSEYSHDVNLAKLETLNVFDKALVYVPEVGIDMEMEINYIRYDGVAEKNLEVRLGNAITSLRETMISPQQRAFNQRVQQLDREIAKSLMSSDGKSRVYWMATKPVGQFEIGDLWFDITLDGGIYVWDGYDWVPKLPPEFGKLIEESVNAAIDTAKTAKQTAIDNYDNAVAETERLVGEQNTAFDNKFITIQNSVDAFTQSVADIDAKAGGALEKAGANADLLTTHQNTIDTINNTTLPDINKSLSDMLGKADFQVFKTTYEANDKTIKARLLAIDSDEDGSFATRLNKTESTASGNTNTISDIKKTPEDHITGYQTIKERSNLYERVIGKDEAGIKSNMARMVMTDSLFKTEVIKNVPSAIGGRNYVLKSDEYYYTTDYRVASYDLSVIPKGTKIKISIWGALGSNARTFGIYVNNASGTTSGNSQKIELTKLSGVYGRGRSAGLSKWTAEVTLGVDASKIHIYGLDNNSTTPKRIEYVQIETGDYYTDWTAAQEDKASMSALTLLENSINLKVSDSELISRINVQAGGILITSGTNKLNITPETTFIKDATIKSAMIHSIDVGKITGIEADFAKMVTKGLTANVIESEHINATVALVNKIFSEEAYIKALTSKSIFANQIKAIEISASKITTGELDGSKASITNIDASKITSNVTNFMRTSWNQATGGGVTITGSGVRAINSEGSRVTLENGVVSVGNRAGVNLGFFGDHILNTASTGTMTITASHGTETAFISATSADGKTYMRSMSIMAGAGEIDMFTTLDMNENALKDVSNIGFTGGLIKGNVSGSAKYMTIDAGTGTSFDISGTTRMSITSVVNIFSGIDMRGKDIASVGKLSYSSDQRLKTNIKDTNIRALDAIRNWQLVSYDWLESGEHVDIGLIAQNSPEVMIYNEENDVYGIDAGKQTMINTLAIQQLYGKTNDEVSQLKAQVASLQEELAILKGD